VNSFDMQERLGSLDRTPRFAIAYKFLADAGITKLMDIHLQVGRSGVITPVAILEPIILNNVTITRATLHNFDEIERKDIRIGDHVFIKRAGDVIPKIQGVFVEKRTSQEKVFPPPSHCPCCKTILIEDGTFLRCLHGFACRAQALARFEHFISAKGFNVQGMGPKILEKLYDMNILRSYVDFFKLVAFKDTLVQTPGFGEIICQKLLDRIERAKTISLSSFIYALGIAHVGEVTAKLLAASITSIHDLCDEDTISRYHGIGEETKKAIYDYMHDPIKIAMIKDLEAYVVLFQPTNNTNSTENGPLANDIVLFTGTLTSMTRAQAKRYVEMLAGRVASSFSSQVSLLVYGEKPGSTLKKAHEMNIRTMNEEAWNRLIKKS
jgi:DNA ligase (NAD+)